MLTIDFPSSFKAEFRPMTGAEITALVNRPGDAIADAASSLLRATWTKTIDPGPYTHADGDLTPQFDAMFSGDLLYGFIATAVDNVPNGRTYEWQVMCERRHDDRQYKWKVDLLDNLLKVPAPSSDEESIEIEPPRDPVRRLSAETIKHIRDLGNRFQETAAGAPVTYKLGTRVDAEPMRKLLKDFKIAEPSRTEVLAVQCIEVAGLKSQDIRQRYAFFRGLAVPEVYRLFDAIQAPDCGIDVSMFTRCPVCGWEQQAALPFDLLFASRTR